MHQTAFVIMAKAPRPGEVKTRLCPPLTPTEAADLAQCFILDTIAKVQALPRVTPVLSYAPDDAQAHFADWASDFQLQPQRGQDLGARMANCFAELFQQGFRSVLLTGCDLPTLPSCVMRQALNATETSQADVILGPSEDGGYYLIGMHTLHHTLFDHMTWSTPRVFAETVQRAEQRGLQLHTLPPWYDIDTPDDLDRLHQAHQAASPHLPPHTRDFIQHYFT